MGQPSHGASRSHRIRLLRKIPQFQQRTVGPVIRNDGKRVRSGSRRGAQRLPAPRREFCNAARRVGRDAVDQVAQVDERVDAVCLGAVHQSGRSGWHHCKPLRNHSIRLHGGVHFRLGSAFCRRNRESMPPALRTARGVPHSPSKVGVPADSADFLKKLRHSARQKGEFPLRVVISRAKLGS